MPKLELLLTTKQLQCAAGALVFELQEGAHSRVTLANGERTTLEELLGGPVKLAITNETIFQELPKNEGQDSRPRR